MSASVEEAAAAVAKLDDELRSEIVKAQAAVARWTTEQKQNVDNLALHAARSLEEDKENAAKARDELERLTKAEASLAQQRRDDNLQLDALKKEVDLLKAQEDALPAESARLAKSLDAQRQAVLQRQLAYQEALASKEGKLSELEKGCAAYRAMLGLEFERVGDERLRLVMTNIDARAPARAFAFTVFVDSTDNYHIEACEPTVDALGELQSQLNQTNDFSAFVRGLRRAFKAMCA